VQIRLRDGRTVEADFPHQRGGPENPMSADEVQAKFRENAALALGPATLESLEEGVLALEDQAEPRSVFALLGAAKVAA
jgi:hypothetical protein